MSAIIPNQKPFRTGQSIGMRMSEEVGNLPITAVQDLARHAATNLGIPVERTIRVVSCWPAKIVAPAGGATVFTNENYYLERQGVTTDTGSDHTAVISTETLPGCIQTVIGVNVAEKAAGTHLLSVGTYVLVFEFLGQDGTARRQYLFNDASGSSSGSLTTVYGTFTLSAGSTFSAVPAGSISLTPGIWEISGRAVFQLTSGRQTCSYMAAALSLTTSTFSFANDGILEVSPSAAATFTHAFKGAVPSVILDNRSVGGTTTVYMNLNQWEMDTLTLSGSILAKKLNW